MKELTDDDVHAQVQAALERPVDLALWRRADGQYVGVLQDWSGSIPPPLRALTPHWSRLAVPTPLSR